MEFCKNIWNICFESTPVNTLLWTGQIEELLGDGRVGNGHDEGGQDQDDGQHVQLKHLPMVLKQLLD